MDLKLSDSDFPDTVYHYAFSGLLFNAYLVKFMKLKQFNINLLNV